LDNKCHRLDTKPECDGRTDEWTETWTESPDQYRAYMLTRDKKVSRFGEQDVM